MDYEIVLESRVEAMNTINVDASGTIFSIFVDVGSCLSTYVFLCRSGSCTNRKQATLGPCAPGGVLEDALVHFEVLTNL